MTSYKNCLLYCKIFVFAMLTLLTFGCAVQQKPQGGPRDITPPKLLKANPPNLTRNFTAKQIRLDFDEYFRLVNPLQEITIFPWRDADKRPDFKTTQKSLLITFKDTLQKNTTYVINFGAAIHDVNEGNLLKNFTYVFSTGSHIDSLSISGSVTDVLTQKKEKPVPGQPSTDVTVMLFTLKEDSLLFDKKKKPTIYTTADTSGNFTLNNLKAGVYKIYALKENAPNKIYDNETEQLGFLNKPINLQHDTSGVQLKLATLAPTKLRFIDHRFDTDGKMQFIFNRSLEKPSVRIAYPPGLDEQKIVDISKTRDTILVYSKNMDFDSVRFVFFENNKPVDTTYLHKLRKESFPRTLLLNYGLSKSGSSLKPGTDLHIYANEPIDSYDPSLITLMEDSTAVNFTLLKDPGSAKNFTLKYRWRQRPNYTLTVNDGAFTDIYGDRNKKRVLPKFVIDNPLNYGTLILKVSVPDTSKAYIVELLNDQYDKTVLIRSDEITKNTSLVYKDFPTTRFIVRVIYDDNRNGKWDGGNLKEKIQPENIWIYNKAFDLRPNWELNEDLNIPKEVTSP